LTGSSIGKVYLIGAGPGDPGLITVKGLEALKRCDVVVHDYLANPQLLECARPDAELIYVGKKAGAHTMRQHEINALLVEKASAGRTVARLKGGDPFVFGRGGEEALALAEHGLQFEIVPGVTAAIAASAYAGVPVTHRGIATSFGVVTGHEDPTKPRSEVDWKTIARGVDTLAVYMGVKNLPTLTQGMLAGGRPASTPAAVISWGTTPRQRCVHGTLSTIADNVREAGITAPAITLIGDVVSLREKLNWFEKLPLFGNRIVTTRPRRQTTEMAASLQRLGAEVIVFPTIRIEPVTDYAQMDDAIARLAAFRWIIFTSINGVEMFFDRMLALGRDARSLASCKVAAIGPATAQALRERFVCVDCMPREYVAEEVVAALQEKEDVGGKRILLPCAGAARPVLPHELRRLGAEIEELTLYETSCETDPPAEARQRIADGEVDVITFTSSSTVANFAKIFGEERAREISEKVMCASIGPITSQTARELGIRIKLEADEHTTNGLVRSLCEWFAKA